MPCARRSSAAESGPECSLFFGGPIEGVDRVAADFVAGSEPERGHDIGRHRPGRPTPDQHPQTAGAAGIGHEIVDDHSTSSSSLAVTTTSGTPTPSSSRTRLSTSASSAGLSLRKSLAFSRPCPIRWSP